MKAYLYTRQAFIFVLSLIAGIQMLCIICQSTAKHVAVMLFVLL